jgi:hypothetical protein
MKQELIDALKDLARGRVDAATRVADLLLGEDKPEPVVEAPAPVKPAKRATK